MPLLWLPYLIQNSSTRGVRKWKCQSCGRQTSLRGHRAETDHENGKTQIEAALLYLSGLSLNAIALLKSVVPSTVLNWVRQFARQRAAKPEPGPGGGIVMDLDEICHFVGRQSNKLWIGLAFCRDSGQLVDWQCGDRDQHTLDRLLGRLATWNVRL